MEKNISRTFRFSLVLVSILVVLMTGGLAF